MLISTAYEIETHIKVPILSAIVCAESKAVPTRPARMVSLADLDEFDLGELVDTNESSYVPSVTPRLRPETRR